MNIFNYVKETKAELRHVSWPTRNQAIGFTVITIVVSLAVAIYLGVFDFIFTEILKKFVF